jgi:SnoaL-like domain
MLGLVNDMRESRSSAEPVPYVSSAPGRPNLPRLVDELFGSIDAMDVAAVVEMFAVDGAVRFGNQERVVGRPGVQQATDALFSGLRALNHSITGVWSGSWEEGEVLSVESEVTYTRADGMQLPPLPATSTLRLKQGFIQDFRVFMDPSPLFTTET